MAVLSAYFDESGFDGPTFVLCGFVATEEMWSGKFDQRWTDLLSNPCYHQPDASENAQQWICKPLEYLHAQEMEGLGTKRFRQIGQRNRDRLINGSINAILDSGIFGVCSGIDVNFYNTIDADTRDKMGSPYLMCMRYVLHKVAECSTAFIGETEDIAYIFEDQRIWELEAHKLYASLKTVFKEKYRMGTIAFGSKKAFKPLQAADRLAYEAFKHYSDPTSDREHWLKLIKHPPIVGQRCNAEGLAELAEITKTL